MNKFIKGKVYDRIKITLKSLSKKHFSYGKIYDGMVTKINSHGVILKAYAVDDNNELRHEHIIGLDCVNTWDVISHEVGIYSQ